MSEAPGGGQQRREELSRALAARDHSFKDHPIWVRLEGGTFVMGSSDYYPEEAPEHLRSVAPFLMAATPTTNAQFAAFVVATGYRTLAERPLDPCKFPTLSHDQRAPGSLVFRPTDGPTDLRESRSWWRWQPGAQWRHPLGPGSSLLGKDHHPVVQIAYEDALAYADWVGGRLPSEAEHEYAARAGNSDTAYPWGDEREDDGKIMANTWYGRFPYLNRGAHGWVGTSPVGSFDANNFGLYDCIGNVWEWTGDLYEGAHHGYPTETAPTPGIRPRPTPASRPMDVAPRTHTTPPLTKPVPQRAGEYGSGEGVVLRATGDPRAPVGIHLSVTSFEVMSEAVIPNRVIKGGSHLNAPEQSLRYRPAARAPQPEDSATSHIGFRCVLQDRPPAGRGPH